MVRMSEDVVKLHRKSVQVSDMQRAEICVERVV